ncbi:kinesin-like protein KIN-7O isoform X1 [Ricinus communis]|uniref:kinesin-like protein KIN-7O isoform X1 n=1 Tax=Ricinus communis TaxID=3988 RepID=UPI00201A65FF|nr:kinesin-like protein KIN-7O isoform X1 [Ricinus communis]
MERIHVTVRARPLSPEDAKTSPWRLSGNSIFIPNHSSKFEFDKVFGEDCKTEQVYRVRTKEIVGAAIRGFNGTVFAYGQTNSGKTHTMRGSTIEPGVIPLAVHDLFDIIQQEADREFLLRMSYMEIYNEDINDLLAPEHRKLQIHESLERGIYVAGLREEIVASPQQVLDLMQFGESHRHIGETNMNLYSSRSHTIFRMIIESRDRTEDEDISSSCDAVRVSVLNLVDLAGSERAAKTGAEGVRLKEGSHINKSLMTLGTVIKKLSEGAESQGGHVPYRDSKLTRILQPALGGNANTAIICNITLAQIHTDETKSSLQFASRALRVTNCAHVNEILTDAALLKRQKKEIEELRAKLQGSRSEHLEEEILNLRNTLLQSELERERITLELEEEKRAQAEREKVLQEQAKKIKNLSSMVLHSNRDENRDLQKKGKRRDTWCPGKLSRETLQEVDANIQSRASSVKPMRHGCDMKPLIPFEELVSENEVRGSFSQQHEGCNSNSLEDCTLPDPCALLHVTNRRKGPLRRKGYLEEDHELVEMQAEYEQLFQKFETQRTLSEIQIDCLTRQLAEADLYKSANFNSCTICNGCRSSNYLDKNVSLRESEAIHVIKQLQEKIKTLEMEKSSSQQNLDSVVEIATEQSICAREKFEELHEELQNAREEARAAREQLASEESARIIDATFDAEIKLSLEIQAIESEVENSRNVLESVSSLLDEVFENFSAILDVFNDFKAHMCQSSQQQKLITSNHEQLYCCMRQKIAEVESEKLLLYNQSVDLQKQIQEMGHETQNYEESLRAISEQHDLEKEQLLSQIQSLEKEISSCSLAKEKENLRKDLEKTKVKLKETEFKLKSAIQEKTKLEGEKSFAEREVKRLHGQNTRLERDISKRDSLAGRRRDSVVEGSSKMFDSKKTKGAGSLELKLQVMEEDYRKLEVFAFEMETMIASLEEEVATTQKEKEEAVSRNDSLTSELEALFEKLNITNSDLNMLQEEVACLRQRLEDSILNQQTMENSIKLLAEEKEELAMQLTNSLLEMEEEKAIWSAKEKVSVEAIDEKAKLFNMEITSLSKALSEARRELDSCREECKVLQERLTCSEENAKWEMKSSVEKSLEIDQLKDNLKLADAESKQIQENLQNQLLNVTKERDKLMAQIERCQSNGNELESLTKRYDGMLLGAKSQVEELNARISSMAMMQNGEATNSKEKAKLRMRLQGTQARLDAFQFRYKEAMAELDVMNREYKEATVNLKDKLALFASENLNLKKQIASQGLK